MTVMILVGSVLRISRAISLFPHPLKLGLSPIVFINSDKRAILLISIVELGFLAMSQKFELHTLIMVSLDVLFDPVNSKFQLFWRITSTLSDDDTLIRFKSADYYLKFYEKNCKIPTRPHTARCNKFLQHMLDIFYYRGLQKASQQYRKVLCFK